MLDRIKSTLSKREGLNIVWFLFLLVVINYVAYGLFYTPAIYSDDWSQGIERAFAKNAQWFDLSQRRILLLTPFLIQRYIFGLNLTAHYIILWFLRIPIAIMLYLCLNHFSYLRRNFFSLVITLLFLVYPTNYTHMWLTIVHIYYAAFLTLLYGYLLLKFIDKSSWLILSLSLISLVLSLEFYEAQLGVACLWSITVLVIYYSKIEFKQRLGLLSPILAAGLFTFWRTLGYQTVGINDRYLNEFIITPGYLLSSLVQGYKLTLVWGWATTIQYWVPWLSGNTYSFLFLIAVILVSWVLLNKVINEQKPSIVMRVHQRWSNIRFYLFVSFLGFIFIPAGYLPIVTIFLPNLEELGSRVNFFASLGGAIFLASALMIGATLFAKNQDHIRYFFLTAAITFILLGVITQASVQYSSKIAWLEQQSIWNQLFEIAPSFEDETFVLFILHGYEDRTGFQNWHRTPLYGWWGASAGVRLLYNNPSLSADLVFPDITVHNRPTLTKEGVVNQFTGNITPYSHTVAFVYHEPEGILHQLDELSPDLVEGVSNPIKLSTERVLTETISYVSLRRLVQN